MRVVTWPDEDDGMNMTEICERDQKLTMTNILLVNLTEISNKICHNDKHCLLKITKTENTMNITTTANMK